MTMTICYSARNIVTEMRPRILKRHKGGHGDEALFEDVLVGWDIVIDNHVYRTYSSERPPIRVGEPVEVFLSLTQDAPKEPTDA